ncbi:uncharacterized protein JCM6883_000866 [Sporobolomyces salmoneus]|uniref:uncharacterized protein n=1 Tax=Sporobolomyces salmoneus TaxID=183962 RepID=UPI00316E106E
MSSVAADGAAAPTDDSPSSPVSPSPSPVSPPRRPGPGQAGLGDESEETTTQPPRFTTSPAATSAGPATTSNPPVATTSNPPPPPPSPTTTSPQVAATTRPDPSPQATSAPANSPSPSPIADDSPASPQSPSSVPTSLASPLAGVNNIVSPSNNLGGGGGSNPTALNAAELVSILTPSTLPDGSTTTIAIMAPNPVLLTPSAASATQGFVTATRSRGAQSTDGVFNPGTGESGDPTQMTPSEKRGRDSAQITGIALGALVVILLALVFIPKFIRKFKNRDKEPSKADQWKPGQTGDRGIGYQKREKEDDEVSWFSGSTTHGDLSEDGNSTFEDEKRGARMRVRPEGGGGGDDSSFHLVQTLPYQPSSRSKNNIAGIGRRDTLRSIVLPPNDVPPPQAEFAAMPRTPTIIYSPPPEDSDLAVFRSQHHHHEERSDQYDTPVRRNVLTPLGFPTTPSSFPSTPASAIGHNPFSTPPLSGLYSSTEWAHILATPPDHHPRDLDTPSPPPPAALPISREPSTHSNGNGYRSERERRRSTMPASPNLSHCAPPSSYNDTDSLYSNSRRSSIPSPTGSNFFPSQAQLLQNLKRQQEQRQSGESEVDGIWPSEVRLEGLAKAAARIGGREPSILNEDEEEELVR